MDSARGRLPRVLFLGTLAGIAIGCAGTGPPLVQHPRSSPMTAVSPENDPLAGALRYEEGASEGDGALAPAPTTLVLNSPASEPPAPVHVALDRGEWSLALGPDETSSTVSPLVALDAALWMSAGPAPRLSRAAHGTVAVVVSEQAVTEGAWEEQRRHIAP